MSVCFIFYGMWFYYFEFEKICEKILRNKNGIYRINKEEQYSINLQV